VVVEAYKNDNLANNSEMRRKGRKREGEKPLKSIVGLLTLPVREGVNLNRWLNHCNRWHLCSAGNPSPTSSSPDTPQDMSSQVDECMPVGAASDRRELKTEGEVT